MLFAAATERVNLQPDNDGEDLQCGNGLLTAAKSSSDEKTRPADLDERRCLRVAGRSVGTAKNIAADYAQNAD